MFKEDRRKISLKVIQGALVELPDVFEGFSKQDYIFWMAIIEIAPLAPGGLQRRFFPRLRGDFYFLVRDMAYLYAPVEIGAKSRDNTTRKKFYGVIVGLSESNLELLECISGLDAVVVASEVAKEGVKQDTIVTKRVIKT